MTAWKDLERRVCSALGGRRAGPQGAAVSDCIGTPYAVECKRTKLDGPAVRGAWVKQARAQSRNEDRPWLLVVAGHNDRHPIAVMDFYALVQVLHKAGLISADA